MKQPDRERQAREALDRVARDSETLGRSSIRRAAEHFAGQDAGVAADGRPDPAEIWGRRVGRALSAVLCLVLAWWLGVQLGWWPAP
jgi:hypothetical protein